MDEKERVSYATLAFQVDFAKIGRLDVWPLDQWQQKVIPKPDVDPEEYHKHLGVMIPALTDDCKWIISICPELICQHAKRMTDSDLTRWVLYLIAHVQMHLIIVDWAIQIEPLDEINLDGHESERRVNRELEAVHPDLFHFGETVKYHVENNHGNRQGNH